MDADARSTCLTVELGDPGDERARVRKVDVMASCLNARARKCIGLCLKWTGRIDQHASAQYADVLRAHGRRIEDSVADRGPRSARKLARAGSSGVLAASSDDDFEVGLAAQPFRYPGAEGAVAANDKNAAHVVLGRSNSRRR